MFSVVIITHNRHSELRRAVSSVVAQTMLPEEIIVIDDGSTNPVDLRDVLQQNPGLQLCVIRNEKPFGPSGARNIGIMAAHADWVAFLDDDDEFIPTKIETLTQTIKANPDVDVLYHPAMVLMVNEKVSYPTTPYALGEGQNDYMSLLEKNVIGGTSMVSARKNSLVASGMFDESLRAFEDYDLWIRLAQRGSRFHMIPDPLTKYYHTTRKQSVTKSREAGLSTFDIIEKKYAKDFNALSPIQRSRHEAWKYNTVIHRAILNLDYRETLVTAMKTALAFPNPKQVAIAFAALIGGPRTLIKIRARISGDTH